MKSELLRSLDTSQLQFWFYGTIINFQSTQKHFNHTIKMFCKTLGIMHLLYFITFARSHIPKRSEKRYFSVPSFNSLLNFPTTSSAGILSDMNFVYWIIHWIGSTPFFLLPTLPAIF